MVEIIVADSIILKHLKRAIVSPAGGFQVIADLNAYHAFIVSLKQPTLVPYFAALKMVANLYIVDSPRDLAGLVKDAQRYEGTLRGEECVSAVASI
jgi:recyclin-1